MLMQKLSSPSRTELHSGSIVAPALDNKNVHMHRPPWHVFSGGGVTHLHAELLLDARAQVQHQHLRLQPLALGIVSAISRSLHALQAPRSAGLSSRVLRCRQSAMPCALKIVKQLPYLFCNIERCLRKREVKLLNIVL